MIPSPALVLVPWCSAGTAGTDFIIPPLSASSSIQNQRNGWTPIFQQPLEPDGSGGLLLTRQQTNGVLRLYSESIVWVQAGGTFTFQPSISAQNTGYNAGAVLFFTPTNQFVISLVDNNTADFNANPALIDGINWQYLSFYSSSNVVGDYKYSEQSANHGVGYGAWLRCNGAVYDPILYPALFALLGTKYGGTSLAPLLPNIANRVMAMSGVGHASGSLTGADTVVLTTAQMPSHTHTQNSHQHQCTTANGSDTGGGTRFNGQSRNAPFAVLPTGDTTATNQNTGGGGAHPNIQPTIYVENAFIFAR